MLFEKKFNHIHTYMYMHLTEQPSFLLSPAHYFLFDLMECSLLLPSAMNTTVTTCMKIELRCHV